MHDVSNLTETLAGLQSELRRLRRLSSAAIICSGVLAIAGCTRSRANTKFDEIDVERINVREKDGSLRFVLSNTSRSPGCSSGDARSSRRQAGGLESSFTTRSRLKPEGSCSPAIAARTAV